MVNGLVYEVSVPRHFLNDTKLLNMTHAICANTGRHSWSGAHPFYWLTYLCLAVSQPNFGRSGVVNGLICGISVPRHFTKNTNILYITNVVCENTWKSQLQWPFIPFYSLTHICLAVSESYFGCPGVVNCIVCGVLVSRHFLNDMNIFMYPIWRVPTPKSHNSSGAHSFL